MRPRQWRAERGYTLVEMLLALVIALVVIGGPLSFIIVSINQANAASSRSFTQRSAETMLERFARELREAQYVPDGNGVDTTPVNITYGGGTSSASFYLPVAGSSAAGTSVTWTCTAGGSCTRTAGGVTATELVGVSSASFTPLSSATGATLASGSGTAVPPSYPSSVRVTLKTNVVSQLDPAQTHVVAGVSNPIVVQDGVALRNYS